MLSLRHSKDREKAKIARTWLQVELVSAAQLQAQEYRLGDLTLGLVRGERKLRPYVEVTIDGKTEKSHRREESIENVDDNGAVTFSRRVFFPFPAPTNPPSERSSSTTFSPSSPDKLQGRIAVRDKRKIVSAIRGDPLIGETEFPLPTEEYKPEQAPIQHCLQLRRKGDEASGKRAAASELADEESASEAGSYGSSAHGQVTLQVSVLDVGQSLEVLVQSEQHPIHRVARAIAELLRIPDFLTLLLDARPKEHMRGDDETRVALRDVWEDFFCEVGVSKDESDAQMIRRLSRLARSILNFVADAMKQASAERAQVVELAVRWLKGFIQTVAVGALVIRQGESNASLASLSSSASHTSSADSPVLRKSVSSQSEASLGVSLRHQEDPLYRFFASAQIQIEDLEPVDKDGQPCDSWPSLVEHLGVSMAVENVPKPAYLGTGSFGLVWRARDKHTGSMYAVKNMKVSGIGFEAIAQRECEIADHLCKEPHPCIMQIFHVGNFQSEEADLFYLIMEICSGGDLSDAVLLARRAAQKNGVAYSPPVLWRRWIGQILLGLEHLHLKMDTLLRDLKPENVVLNDEQHAKLTDFGFSRIGTQVEGGFGTFGVPPGTPHYISPEVVLGFEYDGQADLFSLGILIWVVATGGVRSKRSPVPPCADFNGGYGGLSSNRDLVAAAIAKPAENDANPVNEPDAADLILRLIVEDPSSRPTLEDVRKHPLMDPLNLPPVDSKRTVIEEWLDSDVGTVS